MTTSISSSEEGREGEREGEGRGGRGKRRDGEKSQPSADYDETSLSLSSHRRKCLITGQVY